MKRIRVTVILMRMLLLIFGGANTAHADNLYQSASHAGSFKTFLSAVKTAGLTQKLQNSGPYTLFAPTDSAFSRLPEGEWEALSKDKVKLARLVNYHLIAGKVKVTEVKPGEVTSVEGSPLELKSDNGMVTVNDARVTESDMSADNGVIHAIDQVLIPPERE
jgi:uncharacterized surface protein with fasciclin (FAS1) repeats